MKHNKINKDPLVSWIIPVASGEKWLDRCLDSIVNQTYINWEALIIINGEVNFQEYQKIKDKYCTNYTNKKIYFFTLERKGMANALNFGLKKSKGKWIARIDADDYCLSTRIEKQLCYENCDLIFSNVDYVNENNIKISSTKLLSRIYYIKKSFFVQIHLFFVKLLSKFPNKISVKDELCFRNPIPHSSVFIKKEKLLEIGGYASNELGDNPCQDIKTWHKLVNYGCKFFIIDEVLTFISIHSHQITGSKQARFEASKIYYDLFKKNRDFRSLIAAIYQLLLSFKSKKRYD